MKKLLLVGTAAMAAVGTAFAVGALTGRAESAQVVVYKSPSCGCCAKWVDHLKTAGYSVETIDRLDLAAIKREHGVPAHLSSCHTAVVDGYVIEGHVPASDVERLLREKPDIAGLTVPGMPIGSPGMEGPNPESYDVLAFRADGQTEVYATHRP